MDDDTSEFHFSPIIRDNHVWDAVLLLCLFEDYEAQHRTLVVPHGAAQSKRLRAAMEERNVRLQSFGLGQTLHRCKKCTRFFDRRDIGEGIGE